MIQAPSIGFFHSVTSLMASGAQGLHEWFQHLRYDGATGHLVYEPSSDHLVYDCTPEKSCKTTTSFTWVCSATDGEEGAFGDAATTVTCITHVAASDTGWTGICTVTREIVVDSFCSIDGECDEEDTGTPPNPTRIQQAIDCGCTLCVTCNVAGDFPLGGSHTDGQYPYCPASDNPCRPVLSGELIEWVVDESGITLCDDCVYEGWDNDVDCNPDTGSHPTSIIDAVNAGATFIDGDGGVETTSVAAQEWDTGGRCNVPYFDPTMHTLSRRYQFGPATPSQDADGYPRYYFLDTIHNGEIFYGEGAYKYCEDPDTFTLTRMDDPARAGEACYTSCLSPKRWGTGGTATATRICTPPGPDL